MFKKLALTASAIAFALSGCATTPGATTSVDAQTAQTMTSNGPALWRVSDEDTTVYLFGTVHVLPEGLDWLDPTVANALASSGQFVSEIDTSLVPEYDPTSGEAPPPELMAIAQMQAQMALLQTGGTLRDLMEEDDRAEYEAAMQSLGLPVNAFDQFEPWFAMISIGQVALMQSGFDPASGVERTLDRMIDGKERYAFETVEQQLGFFDGLPLESQLEFLDESVEGLPEGTDLLNAMIAEWMEGDADELAEILNDNIADAEIYDVLLSRRNANWAEWIEGRMDQPGTVFIAVGAGHLAGRNSVQDYLAARGFDAERVQY
ncbi:TraB/GumN family protein [Aurantiacibacter aquimixticola]|uniref:TraB/GumN family protein n=1 Tax=Aurantiacibacter aquimixticola TaxID=1958945 RepID=A0A419RRW0_9SPHN|nr:TraB/GumN family protein [Aurantiacibacter aquimixticola]RJY08515.1 TraB/GumN family protein [Aurantiacibacter aquimixticola]